MSGRQEHLRPLESCTRPYGPTGDFHQFARFTAEELEDQVNQGLRPPQDMIQNLFWAAGPADAGIGAEQFQLGLSQACATSWHTRTI